MTHDFMFGSEKSAYNALVNYVNLPNATEDDFNHVTNKIDIAKEEAAIAMKRLSHSSYYRGVMDDFCAMEERRDAWIRDRKSVV